MRVLAIEDNRQFLELMRSHLGKHGFTVDAGETLSDALTLSECDRYDVVVLDLGLPDGDGKAVLERLRRKKNPVPIIVLSARGGIAERVQLLDAGADDYVVKPCDLDELVARIRAVARRGGARREDRFSYGDLELKRESRQTVANGRTLTLRPRELALLELLLRHAGEPVHRDVLLGNLYSLDEEIGSNALDVHVHHLRRRLADAGARVGIATVRGYGYALQDLASAA